MLFPVTFQDFSGSVGSKNFLPEKFYESFSVNTICEINRNYIIFTENGQKDFGVGGFCHGSVGLQETTILFCPALCTNPNATEAELMLKHIWL